MNKILASILVPVAGLALWAVATGSETKALSWDIHPFACSPRPAEIRKVKIPYSPRAELQQTFLGYADGYQCLNTNALIIHHTPDIPAVIPFHGQRYFFHLVADMLTKKGYVVQEGKPDNYLNEGRQLFQGAADGKTHLFFEYSAHGADPTYDLTIISPEGMVVKADRIELTESGKTISPVEARKRLEELLLPSCQYLQDR